MTKTLSERIEKLQNQHYENKKSFVEEVYFPKTKLTAYTICWSSGIERLELALEIIAELQAENKSWQEMVDSTNQTNRAMGKC